MPRVVKVCGLFDEDLCLVRGEPSGLTPRCTLRKERKMSGHNGVVGRMGAVGRPSVVLLGQLLSAVNHPECEWWRTLWWFFS